MTSETRRRYAREYMKKWRAANPGRWREIQQKSYAKHAEAVREKQRARRAKNPLAVRNYERDKKRWSRYGLTKKAFQLLYQAQNNQCALCKRDEVLCVDHDHRTGEVRGLLCRRCNIFLGFLEKLPSKTKWLRLAARYLRGDSR